RVLQADRALGLAFLLIEVRMKRPAELIELRLERRRIDPQPAGQAERGEIIGLLRDGLDLHALLAEVFAGHFGLAMPAHAARHLQLGALGGCRTLAHGRSWSF